MTTKDEGQEPKRPYPIKTTNAKMADLKAIKARKGHKSLHETLCYLTKLDYEFSHKLKLWLRL